MRFPTTTGQIPGYNQEQVDVLFERLHKQYLNPELRLLNSDLLGVVKFDLDPGGYQIPAVDQALAKLAETLLERETAGKVRSSGKEQVAAELASNLRAIKQVLDLGPDKSFSRIKGGYRRSQVKSLLKKIDVRRGEITAPETYELRIASFSRSSSGYDRTEVDEFLGRVIKAVHHLRALS